MSHNFYPIQNSIRRKMDSLHVSFCCATITHRKWLELHDFVPILFLKKSGEDPDRLRITLVFLHKIFENLINTQSHGIKKINNK